MKNTNIDLSKYKDKFDEMVRFFYESDMARFERINKRLWALCIVLLIALIVSNVLWII